ncbi:hypothetical protein TomMM35A_25500 [Sphingobium sp. TomMM35A]
MRYFRNVMRQRQWVIPNPTYAPVQLDGLRSSGRRIVAVGRLVPQKGFDLLLDAFAKAAPHIPNCRLPFGGKAPKARGWKAAIGTTKAAAI